MMHMNNLVFASNGITRASVQILFRHHDAKLADALVLQRFDQLNRNGTTVIN